MQDAPPELDSNPLTQTQATKKKKDEWIRAQIWNEIDQT